jgi:polyisoprenoid-binding protein YceI
MRTHKLLLSDIGLLLLAGLSLQAADMIRYDPRGGSKMRIEGTSVVHDWRAESPLILGFLEVGPGFPTEPGQAATPGKIEARGEATVKVTTLTSRKENGEHFENKMDENIYDMLKASKYPFIVFRVTELTLKETPKSKDAPYLFDSKGDLAIAGVTNKISMPVSILPFLEPRGEKRLKVTGTTPLKTTDYKVDPATFLLPQFKTSEDVTIKFEWVLGQRKAAPAATSK